MSEHVIMLILKEAAPVLAKTGAPAGAALGPCVCGYRHYYGARCTCWRRLMRGQERRV